MKFKRYTFTAFLLGFFTVHHASKAQTIGVDEALKSLAPLPWVELNPQKNGLQFKDEGEAPFLNLSVDGRPSVLADPEEADLENDLFSLKSETFIQSQNAKTFREAQVHYFSNHRWDEKKSRYEQDAPLLKSWGGLPYPPLREKVANRTTESVSHFNHAFDQELDLASGTEWVRNESLKLYQNGDALAGFLDVVQKSKQFVYLNDLSLVCDPKTEPLIAAMIEKAESGTDVRIILNKFYAYLDRPCLKRLKQSGVSIVTVRSHASYIVNDKDDVLVGSESVARMFFAAHGYDFLDRDMMLLIHGPSATDALHDFIGTWEDYREENVKSSEFAFQKIREKKLHEMNAGSRGPNAVRDAEKNQNRGICRFVSQNPTLGTQEGRIQRTLRSLITHSSKNIFLSGVRFDPDASLIPLIQNKSKEGVTVDLLGNSLAGADGELSQYLDEVSTEFKKRGGIFNRLGLILDFIRNRDAQRVARLHASSFEKIAKNTSIQTWGYFHFLHYKVGFFDQAALWIGSSNLDDDNFKNAYESGVLCIDQSLTQEIAPILARDLQNSIPYRQ